MIKKLQKIWNDSVWSKVISVGILFLITLINNKIVSISQKISFKDAFLKFWNYPIKLWICIVVLIILSLIMWIYYILKQNRTFKYDDDTIELDCNLYMKIRDEFLTEDMIMNVKQNIFSSNAFYGENLFTIIELTDENRKAYFEFLNPVLEEKKEQLLKTIGELRSVTVNTVSGIHGTPGWLSIPKEWAHSDRKRFDDAWKNISSIENELAMKYDDFIKTGKRILKV
ncbi:hypothetical protein [Chryseobacterium sp. FH1]|uniref:hypothetical protein n=1 Tax=Chryseobacterium sp. FH1 TaxID=1233951 RepID=UPI0004E3AA8B|nr:hypothetical protein [Chryseobacterium sp. FH1]KFC19318.1 hypothetical protein IO90_08395 [Chryseobacterium sp. FH1]